MLHAKLSRTELNIIIELLGAAGDHSELGIQHALRAKLEGLNGGTFEIRAIEDEHLNQSQKPRAPRN